MSNSNTSSGIGLGGATFLVFLILKLTNNIDWSWIWVTSPLWLIPVTLISLVLVGGGIALFMDLISNLDFFANRRSRKVEAARAARQAKYDAFKSDVLKR